MAELGVGYISIIPDGSKIIPEIRKSLGGIDNVANKQGKSMGARIASGLGGVLKKSVIGVGASAGAALGAGLTKGISRLTAIENAEAKLSGLGNSAKDVAAIMENANAAVKGTAYGLDEAATTAAMAVASGVKPGAELEQVLKTVADTAGIAGASMSDMGSIFGSVAARGKLQGDDLMQLNSRGIPVLQMLAKELGVTSEEVSDMVSKGKVDFKTFEKALRNGVGGAALEAGKTTQGAFKNMWAAAGRLGATLAGPFYNQAAGAFTGVTTALDGLNDRLKPVMQDFGTWLTQKGIPAITTFGKAAVDAFRRMTGSSEFRSVWEQTKIAIMNTVEAAKALAPSVGNIISSLGQASAALGISGWQIFAQTLGTAAVALQALSGPLEAVSGFLRDHPAVVTAAVAAWTGFKTIPKILDSTFNPVAKKLSTVRESFQTVGAGIADIKGYYASAGNEVSSFTAAMTYAGTSSNKVLQAMGQGYTQGAAGLTAFAKGHEKAALAAKTSALASKDAFTTIDLLAQQAGHSFVASTAKMTGAAKGLATGGFQAVKAGASGLMSFLGGPWAVALAAAGFLITDFIAANQSAKQAQEKIAQASRNAAQAQKELGEAVAGTTGALNEQGLAAATKLATAELTKLQTVGEQKFNIVDRINMATVAVDEFMNKIPGMATETQKAATAQTRAMKDTRDAFDQLNKTASSMGMTMDDVHQAVARGGDEYHKLVTNLRDSGDAGNRAAEELENARRVIQDSVEAARRLSPAFQEAKQAVEVLGDKSASTEQQLSAMHKMMQLLGISPRDAEEAMMDAAEAVDELKSKLQGAVDASAGLGDALFTSEGRLDAHNTNARLLADSIGDLADQFKNAVLAGNDAGESFEMIKPGLEELQQQFGLSEEQLKQLMETFGLIPDEVVAQARLEGAPEVVKELYTVRAALAEVPPGKSVEVDALTDEAVKQLEELGVKVEKTPDGHFKITAEDEEAKQKLEFVSQKAAILQDMDIRPSAHLDADGLFLTAEAARVNLSLLDQTRPFPWADLDISALNEKQLQALQEVGLLDGQTPTPEAYMNIDQLSEKQKEALGKTIALDRERPTPVADLNNDGIADGVADAKSWLNDLMSMSGRTISIGMSVTRWISEKVTGKADGGRVGGYATGGRLPVTGPGTATTDGILGVDHHGMPTARVDRGEWVINRRSSDKYDRELAEINQGTFPKLPGYATGGKITSTKLDEFARGLEGAPYVWGGVHWGDCSGAMSAIARYAVGMDPWGGRFSTATAETALASLGFLSGKGGPGDLRLGWYNGGIGGGHISGTLPNGINVEMGGARGNGQYGGTAAGADDPQYTNHAYLPVDDPDPEHRTYSSGSAATDVATSASSRTEQGPTSWSEVIGTMAKEAATGFTQDALGLLGIPDTPPALAAWRQYQQDQQQLRDSAPGTAGQSSASATAKSVDVDGGSSSKVAYDPSKGAEQWKPVVETALKKLGLSLDHTARTIEQIGIESGGDPNAVNNSDINAQNGDPSKGLLQVIGATFKQYRSPDLADDVLNPLANIYAAANYANSRYGGLENIWPTKNGYAMGGWVAGAGNMIADAIPAMLSNGEYVVKASRAAIFGPILEAINGDKPMPRSQGVGQTTEYHFHGPDAGDVVRQLKAHETAKSMQFLGG